MFSLPAEEESDLCHHPCFAGEERHHLLVPGQALWGKGTLGEVSLPSPILLLAGLVWAGDHGQPSRPSSPVPCLCLSGNGLTGLLRLLLLFSAFVLVSCPCHTPPHYTCCLPVPRQHDVSGSSQEKAHLGRRETLCVASHLPTTCLLPCTCLCLSSWRFTCLPILPYALHTYPSFALALVLFLEVGKTEQDRNCTQPASHMPHTSLIITWEGGEWESSSLSLLLSSLWSLEGGRWRLSG